MEGGFPMKRTKMRRHARTRFYIGCILREAKEPLSSTMIANRLTRYRETRRYLNNAGSISNLILGADGIRRTNHYPQTYHLTDWEAFRRWIGLDDNKWRSIENLTEHYSRDGNKNKDYRRIRKGEK